MITPTPATIQRFEQSVVIWLTTVNAQGQPQSSPVWFLWQDGAFVIYSLADTPRLRNLRVNPHVALNLNSNAEGGDVVTIEGTAAIDDAGPRSSEVPAYQAKYLPLITSYGWTAESFARDYPQRVVITPTRLRAS
ncbi:MAG: TIGR03667 family PPOX class F420-dependent oxidoreductase [Chloroflexota bacterium]